MNGNITIEELVKCYISLCLQIFKAAGFSPCDRKNQIDSDLIYRRDLVWMAINTINYMLSQGKTEEANRILTRLSGCNGLCKGQLTDRDCGCGQFTEHDCGCGGQNRKD